VTWIFDVDTVGMSPEKTSTKPKEERLAE